MPLIEPYTLIWLAPPVIGDSTDASRLPPRRASSNCRTPYTALTTLPALNQPSVRQKYPCPRRASHTTAQARNAKWISHLVSPFPHWPSASESERSKQPARQP